MPLSARRVVLTRARLPHSHSHTRTFFQRAFAAAMPPSPLPSSLRPSQQYISCSHMAHTHSLSISVSHTHTLSLPLFVCVCLPLFTNPPNSFRFWSLSFCGLPDAFVYLSPVSKGWVCSRSLPNSSPSLLSQFPKSHCYIVKHWLDA